VNQWPPPPPPYLAPQPYGYPAPYQYPSPYAPLVPVWQCPFCHCTTPPVQMSKINTTGWVLFAVLLVCCFPLFWIGLLVKDYYRACVHCGHRL
jgi:hypothetical protein